MKLEDEQIKYKTPYEDLKVPIRCFILIMINRTLQRLPLSHLIRNPGFYLIRSVI